MGPLAPELAVQPILYLRLKSITFLLDVGITLVSYNSISDRIIGVIMSGAHMSDEELCLGNSNSENTIMSRLRQAHESRMQR